MHIENIRYIISAIFLLFASGQLAGQQDSTKFQTAYTPDFKFEDGVFLNIEQLKQNKPISNGRILTNLNPNDFNFFAQLLDEKTISVYDDFGNIAQIPTGSIWGFASKGILHLNYADAFNRIAVFGQISYFMAEITSEYVSFDPITNMQQISMQTEIKPFLLDYKTDKVYAMNMKNIGDLIEDDKQLSDEFKSLSNRKKKKEAYLFLMRYNEKHPVYLPKK